MSLKRKPGRPSAAPPPPAKRTRLSTRVKEDSPVKEETPSASLDPGSKPVSLPNKVHDHRPLPTIPESQPPHLDQDEWQSIASSGTLSASLERTRQRWLSGQFFQRYWIRTAGRKDSKPVPAGNPSKSWMKTSGPCTIIVEPMIFETHFYVAVDPAMTAAAQQKNAEMQLKRQLGHSAQYQTGPVTTSPHGAGAMVSQGTVRGQSSNHSQQSPQIPSSESNKKPPDPIITLLAAKAGQDSELKALMKIVATGTASPEQLKSFQRHIDELNDLAASPNGPAAVALATGATTSNLALNMEPIPQVLQRPGPPPPRTLLQPPLKAPALYQPTYPAVFEFINSPGASVDRFTFPQHSIIETLGNYSLLASFLVFRKGEEADDPTLFEPDVEYFEPVTVKIDVHPSHTRVLEDIRKSVYPASEVRDWMIDQMSKRKRAPIRHLPLRLPVKSQLTEVEESAINVPPPVEVKKRGPYKKRAEKENQSEDSPAPAADAKTKAIDAPADQDGREGKRPTRRSTRISDPDLPSHPVDADGSVQKADRPSREGKRTLRKSSRYSDTVP